MTYKSWPTADQQQQEAGRTDVVGNFVLNPATGQPYDSANPMPVGATLTPPANQRVNAQAGDFVDGAIATVGAQADTAATSDTGTFSLIALVKRLLQSLTTGNTNTSNTSTVLGATTDAAVTGDNNGSISAKQRGLTKILADVWDSTNHLLAHNIKQIGGQTPTLDNTTILATSMRGKGAGTAGDTSILLDALGQMTVEDFIRYQIMQGNGYSATTGLIATATNANAMVGLQILGASASKNILIYSMYATPGNNLESDGRLNQGNANTPDTNLTASPTVVNQSGAANTTVATVKGAPASVSTQTTVGTQRGQYALSANVTLQLLQNGSIIYIPKNTNGYGVGYVKVSTIGNSAAVSAEWIEW